VAEVETTPSLQLVFKTVPAVHKDAPALQALAGILGGTPMFGGRGGGGPGGARPPSGRLTKALVLDQKVATRASAASRGMKLGGTFELQVTPAPGKSPTELEAPLQAEIDKVLKDGVTDEELARFKNAALVGLYNRLETNTGVREALAQYLAVGTVQDFKDALARTQAVTKDDVQRVAKQYLVKDARNVLITTRKEGAPPEGGRRRQRPPAPPEKEGP
jgi:predicted Zn-dependent peptidase